MANWYVVVQGADPYLKVGNVKTINVTFDSLLDINQKIRSPQTGVEVKDRKWMLKTYPQCFIASELVEWLIKQKITETREQAVGLCSYLVDKQSFHAANSEHKFKDEDLYFAFDDLETSQKNLSDSKARATSRTSAPAKPSLNTLIKQALSAQPGTGAFLPTVGEGPQCRVCKFDLNEKWNFCPNCATHVNRELDVLDASQKLIKEQAEKIKQLQGADTLITNLQSQVEDLRKQNDGLKSKLEEQQNKPFAAAIQSTLAPQQQKPVEEQPAPTQQPTAVPLQQNPTPVQPIQPSPTPVTVAATPVTPPPTQPTTVVQPTPVVAKEPEPVKKEEPKPQSEAPPKPVGFVMPPPKIIAKDTSPPSSSHQPIQAAATTPQKGGGWTTSAPSSNPGSLQSSNEASTNNNLAATPTQSTQTTATSNPTLTAAPTTPATNTTAPLNTSGSNNSTAPTTTTPVTTAPQPAASGWTKARIVPSGGGFTAAVPKGFVAQPATTTTSTTTTTTTTVTQQVSEPKSAPLNKEPLPKQQDGEVVQVIKTTYGKKAAVKQISTIEQNKIKSDAELGIDGSNFDSIVGSQFGHITGPLSAIITGTVQRPETLGSAKLVTLFQVDVFRGQFEWTVFRRFGQFKDLDKSWKSKKVKVIPLPIFSKKADPEAKREGVEKYLHNLLMSDDTALHPLLVNFLLPIQMDDTKPKKMDNLTLN